MSSENKTSIKVIVELHAKPGRRAELKNLLASVVAKYGSVQLWDPINYIFSIYSQWRIG